MSHHESIPAQSLEHVESVVRWAKSSVRSKYLRGVVEHGGYLPDKAGMLGHAEAEAIDLMVYLPTLRRQLEKAMALCLLGDANAAATALSKILGPSEE